MNFKKIAITAAAAGVMLASAMPALAWHWSNDDLNIKIKNKNTNVTNNVTTQANTGLNSIGGGWWGSGATINTGNAGATSVVTNDVNTNVVDLCGCLGLGDFDDVTVDIENKDTNVNNNVTTQANTGLNTIQKKGTINTGNAGATGVVTNFVNTNIVQ